MPGLWTHKWRPIQFTLVVNNFGVNYVGKENVQHLISALQDYYTITHDWKGKLYVGITLDWDHQNHQVHLSLPGYIKAALLCFNYPTPTKRQGSSLPPTLTNYGAKVKYKIESNTT